MESAEFADVLVAGPQVKMIGVAENDVGAELFEDVLRDSLNAGDGTDGHEDWRLDDAVRQLHASETCTAVAGFETEGERHWPRL